MEQIKTIKNRIMAIALFMLVSVSAALAQAQTAKHIVERGETLETIAQKYGVTKDDIVKLNPDAAQFVYVGMELVVPVKSGQTTVSNDITQSAVGISNVEITKTNHKNNTQKESFSSLNSYSIILDVNYRATFSNADKGSYMVEGFFYKGNGWGLNAGIGANYGIVDSDYAGIQFIVGPSYNYEIDNRWLLLASLDYYGNFHKVAEISAIEDYTPKMENKMKLGWGIALSPRLVGTFDQIGFATGLDLQWNEADSKIYVGFSVGVAFRL